MALRRMATTVSTGTALASTRCSQDSARRFRRRLQEAGVGVYDGEPKRRDVYGGPFGHDAASLVPSRDAAGQRSRPVTASSQGSTALAELLTDFVNGRGIVRPPTEGAVTTTAL